MVFTSWMAAAAAVVILLTFMFWSRLTKQNTRSSIDWPLIGMLLGLFSNGTRLTEYLTEILQENNYTVEIKGPKFSNLNHIVTSDPENIHYILSTKFSNFNKGSDFKDIFEDLGDGILAADSESWKTQRRLLHSLFKRHEFLSLVEETACNKVQNGLFKILDVASKFGTHVDMQDLCLRFTSDVTCIFLLGTDLNSLSEKLPEVPFSKGLEDMEEVVLLRHLKPRKLWRFQQWIRLGVERKSKKAMKIVNDFVYQQISIKRELLEKSSTSKANTVHSPSRFDLVSIFMEDINPKPSDEFIRDTVVNILTAGRDTSGSALTWFFYLVATNPLVESKLLEELEVIFQMKPGEPWKFPSISELNKLVYLHATLCETMRLYPPLPINHKASIKPDFLPSGHQVGKKTKLLISIYTMGRMQDIWGADAAVFRPERWISETHGIIDVPSYKYNVFNAGPRSCIGKELSFMEMKIVAAAVIWRYRLRLAEGSPPVKLSNSVILHMKDALNVNVSVRTK